MANGPMGGFMPTPPAPAQPPQVKLDSTASSRGTFSNFLKNLNGATSLNPPSMAPSMGVTSPMLAPAANIDIFNQPVQMMFDGGMVDDFGDFASAGDFSVGGGGFGGTGGDEDSFQQALQDERSTDFDSPATDIFSDDAQASVGTNVGLEKSGGFTAGVQKDAPGRFTAFRSPSFAMRGIARDFKTKIDNSGDDGLTVANYFNTFNPSDDNKDRLAEFESLTGKKADDKLNIGDMQNIMNIQAKYEAGIRNVAPAVQETILNTVNIDDDKKVEDILGSLDLGSLDKKSPTDGIDAFDIQPTFQNFGLPGVSGLPNVKSTRSTVAQDQARAIANLVGDRAPTISEQLQQNVLADRGRALGPITFGDDLAGFPQGERSRGFDEISRVGDDFDTALDIADKRLEDLKQRDINVREMDAIDRLTAGRPSDEFAPAIKSTAPENFEENVGLPFSDRRMRDIERLYNVPAGQRRTGEGDDPNTLSGIPTALNFLETFPREQMAIDIALGRPRGLGEMIRGFTAPNIGMGNKKATDKETIEQFNERTGRSIPENQLVRNNTGRVIGIRDAGGRLITGMDPDAPIDFGDDNQPPIIRPLLPKVEEKELDLPPNIIGGTDPIATTPVERPTVVASPFAKSDTSFDPVTFDAGDLNKLIEALTGVASRPVVSAQDGGLIKAVDDFLAAS